MLKTGVWAGGDLLAWDTFADGERDAAIAWARRMADGYALHDGKPDADYPEGAAYVHGDDDCMVAGFGWERGIVAELTPDGAR